MPNHLSTGHQGPSDVNKIAFNIFQQAIGEAPIVDALTKNRATVTLGRLDGKVGSVARGPKLTSEPRSAIAKKVAAARWNS